MLGLRKGNVVLSPHSELWHQRFGEEELRLRHAMGARAVWIEHVGSTAVCGLSAKPIIDIAVAVKQAADAASSVSALKEIGYEYRGENGIRGRFYFVKGAPRTHHLHVVEMDSELWRNHLLFRDYLRMHNGAVHEYERLKRRLALEYPTDREAYTEGKASFICEVLTRASAAAGG